ncbi:hypothetical protein K504DRAFT_529328 [Pleomassaria siparia CBS 279.74]|uniref:Uncharacterized protein n=1 Tax=Pleomassaria siparia CBS 279.74 TaxID=1314801 RepID=A0A6G1KS02_9PLEO|nr:hypothetical protein K504DRAFT_529328 [Pleomassaria siparia CBS 279.74]
MTILYHTFMLHLAALVMLLLPIVALSVPPRLYPRTGNNTNTCFSPIGERCLGRQISPSLAATAIQKACAQIPTCVPGQDNYAAVNGKIPGYTATLDLGIQCAGVTHWSEENCKALFTGQIDERCQKIYPSVNFQLGYARSACDDTFVSLNFGG